MLISIRSYVARDRVVNFCFQPNFDIFLFLNRKQTFATLHSRPVELSSIIIMLANEETEP